MFSIEISNCQHSLPIEPTRLKRATEAILAEAGILRAEVSIAVVDDAEIHVLNRQYLNHDEPTDVLSFLLERYENQLEGEIVVSADTAIRSAGQFGWTACDELLLYVIHGMLHLVGFDDGSDEERLRMRAAERLHLATFGLEPRETPSVGTGADAEH